MPFKFVGHKIHTEILNMAGIACLSLDDRQILSSLTYEHIQGFGVVHMKVLPEAIFYSAKCVCSENKQYFYSK